MSDTVTDCSETNKQHKDALRTQIEDAYGKIMYTYVAHQKMLNRLRKWETRLKIAQIALSAISAVGIVGTLFSNHEFVAKISSVFAVLLLGLNLYTKEFRIAEDMSRHKTTVDGLWSVIQDYLSLLTDFPALTNADIKLQRDKLKNRVDEIYRVAPRTDKQSYAEAQDALKRQEEQFFNPGEIDNMLPAHLRRGNANR